VGVNCRLNIDSSKIRINSRVPDADFTLYAEEEEDTRFSAYRGRKSMIVTSSAQGDSGLFETNLNDERYLPFEGSGVISSWGLQLPGNPGDKDPCTFDYDTISDVILHIRYTAREGGELLRQGAITNIKNVENATMTSRLFSIRHEFPTEWAAFKESVGDENGNLFLPLILTEEHYPFWAREMLENGDIPQVALICDTSVNVLAKLCKVEYETPGDQDTRATTPIKEGDFVTGSPSIGYSQALLAPVTGDTSQYPPVEEYEITTTNNTMDNLYMFVTWEKSVPTT
jgi:hypothetical protein